MSGFKITTQPDGKMHASPITMAGDKSIQDSDPDSTTTKQLPIVIERYGKLIEENEILDDGEMASLEEVYNDDDLHIFDALIIAFNRGAQAANKKTRDDFYNAVMDAHRE